MGPSASSFIAGYVGGSPFLQPDWVSLLPVAHPELRWVAINKAASLKLGMGSGGGGGRGWRIGGHL